ncbi:hypothetical protein V6N12_057412 [Hibiscus sabdariffa]|uniref:Uncharacterized protein n=1 Tax=Hibiscus sabdariffa TaxID=183260 RepID=A0ABR2C529_9ROSI
MVNPTDSVDDASNLSRVPAKSLSQLNKLSSVYESDPVPIVSGKQADHSGSIESDQVGAEQVDSGAIQQITDQECSVQSMSAPTTSAQVEYGSADCTQEEWSADCEQTDYGQASNGRVVSGCHEQLCQGTRMNGDEVNLAEGTGSFLQNADINEGGGNMIG